MRFHATVQLNGKTATGIEVPAEVVAGLGQGQRPPVRVTIGDNSYRTTVARMGGRFLISLSAENRAAAGVACHTPAPPVPPPAVRRTGERGVVMALPDRTPRSHGTNRISGEI